MTAENPEDGGIIGIKSDNMSCVCSKRNCHCSDLGHIEEVEYLADSDVAAFDQVIIEDVIKVIHKIFPSFRFVAPSAT